MLTLLGWGALALGAALFAWVAAHAHPTTPGAAPLPAVRDELSPTPPAAAAPRRVWVLLALAVGAVTLAVPGFIALAPTGSQAPDTLSANAPWLLWAIAVGLLCVGALVAGRSQNVGPGLPSPGGRGVGGEGESRPTALDSAATFPLHPALSLRARVAQDHPRP